MATSGVVPQSIGEVLLELNDLVARERQEEGAELCLREDGEWHDKQCDKRYERKRGRGGEESSRREDGEEGGGEELAGQSRGQSGNSGDDGGELIYLLVSGVPAIKTRTERERKSRRRKRAGSLLWAGGPDDDNSLSLGGALD